MKTLTLQVTEVLFDFEEGDITLDDQQSVVDYVLGRVFEVEVLNPNDDDEIADVIVEEVAYAVSFSVVSLNYRHVLSENQLTDYEKLEYIHFALQEGIESLKQLRQSEDPVLMQALGFVEDLREPYLNE